MVVLPFPLPPESPSLIDNKGKDQLERYTWPIKQGSHGETRKSETTDEVTEEPIGTIKGTAVIRGPQGSVLDYGGRSKGVVNIRHTRTTLWERDGNRGNQRTARQGFGLRRETYERGPMDEATSQHTRVTLLETETFSLLNL